MSQDNQNELTILNNILFIAKSSKINEQSSRNLLNKWFQDSVKSYVLETVAAPLISQLFHFKSIAELKAFIHSQALSQHKPKYMNIIEQYFFYINKYNQQNQFIQQLKLVLSNPKDFTQNHIQLTYNTLKLIRKQFVCLLILKYFEIYEQQEIPSFYELWNICHPQEIQKKKKLTKYDKQAEQNTKVKQEACNNNEQFNSSSLNTLKSSCSLSQTIQFDQLKQEISSNTNLEIDNFNQSYENTNINLQFSDYQDHKPHKQPINNGIFEEDSYEEESMSHFQQQNKPIYYQDQVLFITQNDFLDYRQEFQRDHY